MTDVRHENSLTFERSSLTMERRNYINNTMYMPFEYKQSVLHITVKARLSAEHFKGTE